MQMGGVLQYKLEVYYGVSLSQHNVTNEGRTVQIGGVPPVLFRHVVRVWGFLDSPQLHAAGKSGKNFPAVSKSASKPFQQETSDSRSLLEFSDSEKTLGAADRTPAERHRTPTDPSKRSPCRCLHCKSPSEKEGPAPRIVTLWKLTRLAQFLPKWEGVSSKRRSTPTGRPLKTTVHMTTTSFFRRRPSRDLLSLHLFLSALSPGDDLRSKSAMRLRGQQLYAAILSEK